MSETKSGWKQDPQEFLQIFRRAVEFTEELLSRNEQLRTELVQVQKEHGHVEFKGQEYTRRYREVEEEVDRLANLYVATYQIHSTLDLEEVVRISFELLINLLGTRSSVLYAVDEAGLVPVRAEGMDLASVERVPFGVGIAGRSAVERVLVTPGVLSQEIGREPQVCIPLIVDEKLIGMFGVFSFLLQKQRISDLDQELIRLLATHTAMALYASALAGQMRQEHRDMVEILRTRLQGEY